MASLECIGNDPLCPCQDGDVYHYVDTEDTQHFHVWEVDPDDKNFLICKICKTTRYREDSEVVNDA